MKTTGTVMNNCTYCGDIKPIVREERFGRACADCQYMLVEDMHTCNLHEISTEDDGEWARNLDPSDPDYNYLMGNWYDDGHTEDSVDNTL